MMLITVDSNILLSIFKKDSIFGQASDLIRKYSSNDFIINDCIYLELAVHFGRFQELDEALDILEVKLLRETKTDYNLILNAWSRYLKKKSFVCPSCKKSITPICPECQSHQSFRQRILVDFMIGAFASANSQGILTLDPAYYKNYFPELAILD